MSLCNLLRVPFLFVIDELFKTTFGFQDLADIIIPVNNGFVNNTLEFTQHYYMAIFLSVIRIIVSCLILFSSIFLFVLPARYLYLVYLHVISFCIVFLSYWANMQSPKDVYRKDENFDTDMFNKDITWDVDGFLYLFTKLQVTHFFYLLFCNLILQCCLALVFECLQVFPTNQFSTNQSINKIFSFSFIIPTLIACLPVTWRPGFLNKVTLLSTLLPIFCALKTLWSNLLTIANLICNRYSYALQTTNYYEVFVRVEVDLDSLKIPIVLRMCWAIQVLVQILYLLTDMEIQNETWFGAVKYLLIIGSNSIIVVLGMTSFVSYFCYSIGAFLQWMLITDEVDDEENIETISAYLFFVLAIQNVVTDLDEEERLIRVYYGIYLLCGAILCYIHKKINSLSIYLSSYKTSPLKRHLRPLLVCGFLIVFPITMLTYLWSHHSVSPWHLAVSSFYIKIIIKVLVSLTVYSLFLIDEYRTTSWEKFDDYVYSIKSFGNTVELCCGISFLLNNSLNVAFLSGGSVYTYGISLIQMCIHSYVYVRFIAKDEWREFNEHHATEKIMKSLSDATTVQLSELNDVCAICIQNMVSAKITQCNHYFHAACVRKLLYASDRTIVPFCPLCQNTIVIAET